MAEDGTVTSDSSALNGASGPQAGLISQYVKDLSVENPNAPDSFQWPSQLSFDVQFRAESRQLNEEVHEMLCTYTIAAKAEQGTAYLVELAYGALVGLRGLDEEQTRRFLFADTPRIVFPNIRLILGNVIRDAGFPPLVLEPIDFAGLYDQQSQDPGFGAAMPPPEGNA
jgi:preprotein translocase subunit SecB